MSKRKKHTFTLSEAAKKKLVLNLPYCMIGLEMQGCDISWTTRGKNGGICLHRLSFVVQPGRFHPTSSAVFRIVFPTRRNSFILGPHFSSSRKSTSSRSYYPTTRGAFLQRPFSAECFMTP